MTNEENIPCFSNSQSNESDLKLTQGGNVTHGKDENNVSIEYISYSLQFPFFDGVNSFFKVVHETSLIYASLVINPEEYYDLGNLFGDVETFDENVHSNSCHPINNDHVEIIEENCLQEDIDLTIP